MFAAAEGRSTLGIPRKVGREFVGADATAGHAAGIIFVAPDGDVLLLRRSSTEKNFAGHWALPGGKGEEGESPEATAAREAIEEIGTLPGGERKLLDQRITPTGMAFHTFAQSTAEKFTPQLNDEHSGWAWAPLDQLPQPLHPALAETLSDRLYTGIGAEDMTAEEWSELRTGFAKWAREEERESEHARDASQAAISKRIAEEIKRGHSPEQAAAIAYAELGEAHDAVAFDKASVRRIDKDGHLHVEMTPISKANICPYWGREIPKAEELGLDPNRQYRLLRDPVELERGAESFSGKPLLIIHTPVSANDHPHEKVVGAIGTTIEFDPPYVMAPLVVWDGEAIELIQNEKQKELSSGYRYRADMTPGSYNGERYDGVMRDIIANHVALVKEGRAGPDVVVGDSAITTPIEKEWSMANAKALSRQALLASGALLAYLPGKLAADAKLGDFRPLLVDVTSKNWKDSQPKIIAGVTALMEGKLAKDAKLDGLAPLLLALDEVEDLPEPGGGKGKGPAEKAKDRKAKDKKGMDRKARDEAREALKETLKEKLSAEDWKAACDDIDGMEAEDAESETEEERKEREAMEAKDKKAKDEETEETEEKTKKAMDAAIAGERKRQSDIRAAEKAVFPLIGEISVAMDSAAEIYAQALKAVGVSTEGVDSSAFPALVKMATDQKNSAGRPPRLAHDAALVNDRAAFDKEHGIAPRSIRNLGA